MRHLIEITDLTTGEIDELLTLGDAMRQHPEAYRDSQRGRILATLFFEPSTRTRLSF